MSPFHRYAATASILLALALAAAPGQAPAEPETFKIDTTHSSVLFRVQHFGAAYFYGAFNDISGTIVIDNDNPAANAIDITIPIESIDTRNERRDNHLKGPDFFNGKQFPNMTFKSTSVEAVDDNTYAVRGDLTIHGETKPIEISVMKTGEGPDPRGTYRAGAEAVFRINRMDYGVSHMPDALGNEVTVILSVEGIRQE